MRRRRPTAVLVLGTLALIAAFAAPASAAVANPSPVLPQLETLVSEGVNIEGPLINNLGLPKGL
ncbi:hypothetical protein ACFPM3_06080 [Streptomyces coeruleoprunus]|uniref:Secreted protein n=1 Tax=Streptomyces coeruleoprunus TaxID=285563 RepID=A0ABV9XCQ9_9ACTN